MKAVISSTYDDKYLYFLPIVTWCWQKLGVDVICFYPKQLRTGEGVSEQNAKKYWLIFETCEKNNLSIEFHRFKCPEHKEATYAQCSRLYAACLDLPEDEVLVTGDVDMAVFEIPPHYGNITIWGNDLVPHGQYPICYASGTVRYWRAYFDLIDKTYCFNPQFPPAPCYYW